MGKVAETTTAELTLIVRPLEDGRLLIPTEFRDALGLDADAVLAMTMVDGELRIREATEREKSAGSDWFKELYDYFAPVREEIVAMGISEDEVNADIDAAVAAVRAEQRARHG